MPVLRQLEGIGAPSLCGLMLNRVPVPQRRPQQVKALLMDPELIR